MKLIELIRSPYWGANIHVGYDSNGRKRYARMSSKVLRDPTRINEHGGREDRIEALKILTELQSIANKAMGTKRTRETLLRSEFENMVNQLIEAVGLTVAPNAPPWDDFATETLSRHTADLSPATVRSYWSKKSTFDTWLSESYEGKRSKLNKESSLSEFKLADMQEFYDWCISSGGQSTTANGTIQGLGLVFDQAVTAEHIAKSPCKGVKRRDNVMIPRQPFTLSDLSAISKALIDRHDAIEFAGEWQLAIKFSIFTGAREGDCVSLRWDDFSDDFRSVRFVPGKKARLHALGKVDASVSLILPEFVSAEFRAAKLLSNSELVTPSLSKITSGKRGLGPRFREIMDFAGIQYSIRPAKGNGGKAQCSHNFHSFRHTIKTELRAGGVSAATSDLLTGHEDPRVAARYVHEKSATIYRECEPVFELFREAINQA